MLDGGVEDAVAHANYYAVIDPLECQACGACVDRCQVDAISDETGISVVDRDRCIGCGLCVTGCTYEVAHLVRKPAEEIVEPPEHFGLWEQARLANREQMAVEEFEEAVVS
jgi:ferredoxin